MQIIARFKHVHHITKEILIQDKTACISAMCSTLAVEFVVEDINGYAQASSYGCVTLLNGFLVVGVRRFLNKPKRCWQSFRRINIRQCAQMQTCE